MYLNRMLLAPSEKNSLSIVGVLASLVMWPGRTRSEKVEWDESRMGRKEGRDES